MRRGLRNNSTKYKSAERATAVHSTIRCRVAFGLMFGKTKSIEDMSRISRAPSDEFQTEINIFINSRLMLLILIY